MYLIYSTKSLNSIYDDKSWEDILRDFQPKINYNLHKVPLHERDDLEQEIKLKIIEKISMLLNDGQILGFWDFISQQECSNDIVSDK